MPRRKSKKSRSNFKLKLFSFLFLLIVGAGYYAYTHRAELEQKGRLTIASVQEKISPTPQPSTAIPEPTVSVAPAQSQQPALSVQSQYDNLALGVPGKADSIIDRPGYSLGYIEYHEQPAWVVYRMTYEEAVTKAAKRGDDFKEDPKVPTGSATLADYRRSGYDRGHLAPAADMAFSIRTMDDSFYMSNMSPQKPQFNRGIWKDLEAQVRQFAITEKDIYVVTGPILPKTKTITIGANKVTVPTHYYKVIFDRTPPEKMIGFILPNEGSNKHLQDFAVTVDAVEDATGLNFFSLVPQPKQEQLESTIMVHDWRWKRL